MNAADGEPEQSLSAAGLYVDIETGRLAENVRAYAPQGELWSDGAAKARWIQLPPDGSIDSTDMDAWRFPVGTRLWKEFALEGIRIETRLLEKTSATHWNMVAFLWNEDQRDAVAIPSGLKNARGTAHDVPSSEYCKRCHLGSADIVIGFSALQLSHEGEGLSLATLVQEGRLTSAPSAPLVVPGDDTQRRALLYLHANCGNCHNDHSFISNVTNVEYWLNVNTLASVENTATYGTLQRDLRRSGSVEASDLVRRMGIRGVQGQMPPIASKQVDGLGLNGVIDLMRSVRP